MSTIRALAGAAVTLSHTFYAADAEDPSDSTATVTVAVLDANGDPVAGGDGDAIAGLADSGTYTYPLTMPATLTALTVAWTATIGGAQVVETDVVEVVGGHLFSLAEGRRSDASLASTGTYPTAALALGRLRVEREAEHICDRAFVPRYARVVLDGSGTTDVLLTHPEVDRSVADLRRVRRISVAPRADEAFVNLSAGQLAAVAITRDGMLRRLDNDEWTEGNANLVVEYEYGLDAPPPDLVDAALTRLRTRLNMHRSGIPDRAESFTATEGGTYRLSMPGPYSTGIPEVDAAYGRYSLRPTTGTGPQGTGGEARPASRQLNFDPQWTSMFHGGVR
jgi:hypothetical protein